MGIEKEGLMERHEAGKWADRMFKITEGKLTYSTTDGQELGKIPLDSSTWVFARPEKDNRPYIFGLLNVRDGKSLVLEVSVSSNEIKEEWISALKAANITYNSPKKIAKKASDENGGLGRPAGNDEVFCGINGGNKDSEKDCSCVVQ